MTKITRKEVSKAPAMSGSTVDRTSNDLSLDEAIRRIGLKMEVRKQRLWSPNQVMHAEIGEIQTLLDWIEARRRNGSNERAAFERYVLTERGPNYLKRNDPTVDAEHDYADDFIQEAWEAWLARSSNETSDARDAARYRYIRNCLHCPETDLLITSRSKAPAECGVYSTNILDAIVDDAIKATSQKANSCSYCEAGEPGPKL